MSKTSETQKDQEVHSIDIVMETRATAELDQQIQRELQEEETEQAVAMVKRLLSSVDE